MRLNKRGNIFEKNNKNNAYEVPWLVSAPICLPSRNFNNVVDWVLFSSLDGTISSVRLRFGGSSSFEESFFFFVFLTTSLAAFLRLVSIVVIVVGSFPIVAVACDSVNESDGSSNSLLVHFSNALDLHALLVLLLRLVLLQVVFGGCWLTIELESSLRSGFIILFARMLLSLSLARSHALSRFVWLFLFLLIFYSLSSRSSK